ncbi:RNA methyltransferase [Corynebacterium sp. sy017]|uniref:TrmH family RNA methyltransferase n=1 Tax=unclassified Corynebacterium TaxID=2624378 RepID=UPI001186C411|nr:MULTISPECIES: TrmH family RNA methyltransferase [unclassified Corynebacterium]MBP3088190.1 RNA methyltransferase [Corynebacterium sp. sy017]TSD92692.1 RNA methyltransferase [Corynebacterium sp. SY003]
MTDTSQHSSPHTTHIPLLDDPTTAQVRRIAQALSADNAHTDSNLFVIDDGENIVQALANGIVLTEVFVTGDTEIDAPTQRALDEHGLPVYRLAVHVAKHLFGTQKRSRLFALAQVPQSAQLSDITHLHGDIIVLDGVKLAGNIGAITRTACALNASAVVLVDSDLTSIVDRRLVRASRGTVFALPVVLAQRSDFVRYVQEHNIALATLSADAAHPISEIAQVQQRLAILMGSERHGPSTQLDSLASMRFSIPMSDKVESLNVSVATAIALFAHSMR